MINISLNTASGQNSYFTPSDWCNEVTDRRRKDDKWREGCLARPKWIVFPLHATGDGWTPVDIDIFINDDDHHSVTHTHLRFDCWGHACEQFHIVSRSVRRSCVLHQRSYNGLFITNDLLAIIINIHLLHGCMVSDRISTICLLLFELNYYSCRRC